MNVGTSRPNFLFSQIVILTVIMRVWALARCLFNSQFNLMVVIRLQNWRRNEVADPRPTRCRFFV